MSKDRLGEYQFCRTGLLLSASLFALSLSGPALAQSGQADGDQAGSADMIETIVVTGTRIKGREPVGTVVFPVGRDELAKVGASTTNDALLKLPQVINFGGSNAQAGGFDVQSSVSNGTFAKSVNLRGLGTAATLSLVNGHRVAPGGSNGQLFDGDIIPGIAIERIEVVADGGSAIYGSDAIGGVVNYIVRRPQNALEGQFRAGFADGVEEYIGSIAAGRTWSTGGIFVAYEHQYRSALKASARSKLYNSDLSPYGGGASPLYADPGNVELTSGGTAYGVPYGQNGSNVTLADLTATPNRQNSWYGSDAMPMGERNSVVATVEQEISDAIKFKADGFYSRRNYIYKGIAAAATAATLSVPNNNPYSPCYTGKADNSATLDCPADGTVYVPYSFVDALGATVGKGFEQNWSITGGFDFSYDDWDANLTGYYAENWDFGRNSNIVNSSALNRALGWTVNGTAKPASVDFFNPFCDAAAYTCNSGATLDLFRGWLQTGTQFQMYGVSGSVGGSPFAIWGGDVRVAVGGEFHHDTLDATGLVTNTYGDNVNTVTGSPTSNSREVSSVYGEVFLPFVEAENQIVGVERLELDAAVRYDHYSDVGSTVNPKIGVNYSPVQGLTLRSSYGTSFRAPSLVDTNEYAEAGFVPFSASGTAVGLSPAGATYQYMYEIGGNASLKPEKATTWSIGVDLAPTFVPGLQSSLTYYNVHYTDRIDRAAYAATIYAALNSGQYDQFVVYNPAYFPGKSSMTLAQYVAYIGEITSDPNRPVYGLIDPATTIAVIDARRNNSGIVDTDGFDLITNYTWDGDFATYRAGVSANYTLNYSTAPVPAAPLTNEVNHFGYPARFSGRLELGLDRGGFSGTMFVNYVNSRKITREFLAASIADKYMHINDYTTFDITLQYDLSTLKETLGQQVSEGLAVTLAVQNLFDTQPPLVINAGRDSIRFDPSYSSPLGRFVSLQVSKKL